jgi:hypothetical protein
MVRVIANVSVHAYSREDITAFTGQLRASAEPLWVRIRELLIDRGINPASSALIVSFPDDVAYEYGVIVTADGRIIQYGFDYLHRSEAEGVFEEWNDITSSYAGSKLESLEIARELIDGSAR